MSKIVEPAGQLGENCDCMRLYVEKFDSPTIDLFTELFKFMMDVSFLGTYSNEVFN